MRKTGCHDRIAIFYLHRGPVTQSYLRVAACLLEHTIMSTDSQLTSWGDAEWLLFTSRTNDIASAMGPEVIAREWGLQADSRSRQLLALGMITEQVGILGG